MHNCYFYMLFYLFGFAVKKAPIPGEIDDLTDLVLKVLNKRTNGNLKVSIPFIDAYIEACLIQNSKKRLKTKDANPDIRNQVLEYLLTNGYVILNPQEGESVFLTQKAIDKFYSNQDLN